ncbi:MAG: hypothetical protein P1U61_02460 [Legionellaceae bacterium]|nr:hypothetical protein [Legionellaceae bacterium]
MSKLLSNPEHPQKTEQTPFHEKHSHALTCTALIFAATAVIMKAKGFSLAFRLYPSGGAGINIYKYCEKQSKPLRRYALDFHPIWNSRSKENTYKLHYHRGESFNQIKKHRPYQGGW